MSETKISAAHNFYAYVNHAWLKDPKNNIPADYASWGGFTQRYDEGLQKQIDIVQGLQQKEKRTLEEEKIFAIWQASQKRFSDWDAGKGDYQSIAKECQNLDHSFRTFFDIQNFEIVNTDHYLPSLSKYMHYALTHGIPNILSFGADSDLDNVHNIVLSFYAGGLSLPSQEYYTQETFADKLSAFQEHLVQVQELLTGSDINLHPDFATHVMAFEKKIAAFTMKPDQARSYDAYYTNTTLTGVYKEINTLRSLESKQLNYAAPQRDFTLSEEEITQATFLLEELYTHFDLRKILTENHTKNFSQQTSPSDPFHVSVYDGDAIRRAFHLILDPTHFLEYRSYMQYKIIKTFYAFCTQSLDEAFFDFYQRKLGGQAQQKPQDKRSINIVNLFAGEMLGKLFVARFFPETSKHTVQALVDQILSVMHHSLLHNDWLTPTTQEKAVHKLNAFNSKIGYPNQWKDYSSLDIQGGDSLYQISQKAKKFHLKINFFDKINSVIDREEWRMTPQTVNAYFMPTQNEIVFPAAILQPPLFHQAPDTIDFDTQEERALVPDLDIVTPANYGAIGAIIAHEITHGYDDKGRKFDAEGNLSNWWEEEDLQRFQEKSGQLIPVVQRYAYQDPTNEKKYKINPQLTMGENLADINGLRLAMKALLLKIDHDNLTPLYKKASLRIFFKSWANIWKQKMTNDRRIMLLHVDPHAPADFRGNLVQHMDEFHDAFDITPDDPMYLAPQQRLQMW